MKKILTFIWFFIPTFFLLFFLFNAKDIFAAGTSYTDVLGNTHYSDGSSSYTDVLGNTHFSNGGTAYTDVLGNMHYNGGSNGTNGTSYSDVLGNTHFNFSDGTNGTAYTDVLGNTHYNDNKGNTGSSYTDVLGNTHYSGDIFIEHKCPANSSYDSLSGNCKCSNNYESNGSSCVYKQLRATTPTCPANSYFDGVSSCKCNYGYVVSGTSCVYKSPNYSNTPTYPSTQSNCPSNSHPSTTDATKCQCDVGYQTNISKDACVLVPTKTNDQRCNDEFGINSNWDGTGTVEKGLGCGCKSGYVWNDKKTSCILKSVDPIKTNDQICQDSFGLNVNWDGTKDNNGYLNCNCKTGYQWNGARTACIEINAPIIQQSGSAAGADGLSVTGDISQETNTPSVIIPLSNVNIRKLPLASAKIVSVAKRGLQYKIVDSTNKIWVKIKFSDDKVGWVMRKYVSISQ